MPMFSETEHFFTGQNGQNVYYRHIKSKIEHHKIVISHGLGEHSGRYANVIEALFPAGTSFWLHDHAGHGKSDGKRGHINTFGRYINDLDQMVDIASKESEVKPILLGHSMGGLIALNYALNRSEKLKGLVVSSPLVKPAVDVSFVLALFAKLMSAILPSVTMSSGLDAGDISHDEAAVEKYRNDTMVHDRVSARWFTQCNRAMEITHASAGMIQLPVMMQVAGDDHLVSPTASQHLFNGITSKDKTLHVYNGLFHEIYNETEDQREKVLDDLKTWVAGH